MLATAIRLWENVSVGTKGLLGFSVALDFRIARESMMNGESL